MRKLVLLLVFVCAIQVQVFAQKSVINNVRMEHNVVKDGLPGMMVHVNCTVKSGNKKKLLVIAWVSDTYKNKYKPRNTNLIAGDGQLTSFTEITPDQSNQQYENVEIFFPYKEMSLIEGKHTYMIHCGINYDGKSTGDYSRYFPFVGIGEKTFSTENTTEVAKWPYFKFHTGAKFSTPEGMAYTVMEFPDMTKRQLYDAVVKNVGKVYISPKDVLSTVDGESVTIRGRTNYDF